MLSILHIRLFRVIWWAPVYIGPVTGLRNNSLLSGPLVRCTPGSHYTGHLGPMPLSPGPMPRVTRYIKTLISCLLSWSWQPGTNAIQPWPGTPAPFWRVGSGKWRDDPTKKFDQNSENKNTAVKVQINDRVETEYIRGDSYQARAA